MRRRLGASPAVTALAVMVAASGACTASSAFALPIRSPDRFSSNTALYALSRDQLKRRKSGKGVVRLADLMNEVKKNPSLFDDGGRPGIKKSKRTRKRVEKPKQRYLYAKQRAELERKGELRAKKERREEHDGNLDEDSSSIPQPEQAALRLARSLGLNPSSQQYDPIVSGPEPRIAGEIRVGDDDDEGGFSATRAYLVEKPAGWAIIGGGGKKEGKKEGGQRTARNKGLMSKSGISAEGTTLTPPSAATAPRKVSKRMRRVKAYEDDGTVGYVEYDPRDILAALTPEEIDDLEKEGGLNGLEGGLTDARADAARAVSQALVDGEDDDESVERLYENAEAQASAKDLIPQPSPHTVPSGESASFARPHRPSIVAWLKDSLATEGTPIRGGNYWKAIAGATAVDDSGLVLLVPKHKASAVHVDAAGYVVVVGNGQKLAPKGKLGRTLGKEAFDESAAKSEISSKLRRGRGADSVVTVRWTLLDGFSNCDDVVLLSQRQFLDGVRGDPAASPFDRRAPRRLLHCESLSVSSLTHDDGYDAETETLPDDLAILAKRRNDHEFREGSFLGRSELQESEGTTAYREVNGDADGFPGWKVDRYSKFLLVQHDDGAPAGPLPSIHDGKTEGVYYLRSNPDRSAMGSTLHAKPILAEGRPASEVLPVLENNITYHVSLGTDLSTGIFLDQRPQRAWLKENCGRDTRVLNCFAHCGAFSIAAAVGGASTVSLDLDKKWLNRIGPQLEANGIRDDERHDRIYGDCFDWLQRLSKRGEKFDIVILDPPSTSVGGKKKKRWSVKNDTPELVALAAPLVKRGGLLWTTTNLATIPPERFARMCKKGLDSVGLSEAKLERIAPMPVDFPSIGYQPVKNLCWRMPL